MKNNWNLSDYQKKESFKTPEGYFETLAPRVMQRIAEQKQQKMRKARKQFRIFCYAAAASVALLLVTGTLWMNTQTSPELPTTLADESTYLDDMLNYAMLDDYMINEYIIEVNQ